VGVARSMTDFHYACYLSDLAVAVRYQRSGIGQDLLRVTSEQLGENCKLILVSAPAADSYYPQHGFIRNERTWVLPCRAGQSA
jgi:predicted N-acetyltransferase YhbS